MFHKKCYIFVAVLLAVCASIKCDSNDLDFDIDKLREKLPAGISESIPDEYKNLTAVIPQKTEEAKKMFKEKCHTLTGDDKAYERIEAALQDLQNCTMNLIDFVELEKEIEAVKPTGELDTVFNKYCHKRNIAIECVETFTNITEPCLEPKEIEGQKTFVKIFTNLLNFVCHKDGDQIALFIAEKGPECFQKQNLTLLQCVNNTFYNYLPSQKEVETKELAKLPQLVLGVEQCNDMDRLQNCFVEALEQCEESTPANLVDSMFKFVRNETPCVNLTKPILRQRESTNAAYSYLASTNLITIALVLIVSKIFAV